MRGTCQFSIRGGLIDVYPINSDKPARIDFFGNEIEEIRTYDPTSQRADGTLSEIIISSAHSEAQDEVAGEFFEYLKKPVFGFFGSLSIYLIPTHWFFTTRRRPKILNHLLPTHLSRTTKTVFFWEQVKFKLEWESLITLNTCKTRSVLLN